MTWLNGEGNVRMEGMRIRRTKHGKNQDDNTIG